MIYKYSQYPFPYISSIEKVQHSTDATIVSSSGHSGTKLCYNLVFLSKSIGIVLNMRSVLCYKTIQVLLDIKAMGDYLSITINGSYRDMRGKEEVSCT